MPIRPKRLLSAVLRMLRGASLIENGILVGLIAVLAIIAVSTLGDRVQAAFCVAALRLDAPVSCDFAEGTPPVVTPVDPPSVPEDPEGLEDPEAPIAPLTLAFDVPGDVFDLDDPQAMRFTVGGLRDNAAFDWQIVDTFDAPYLSGSGHISGASSGIDPEAGEPRPGRITVSVTAPLPDGSTASAAPIVRELVTMDAFPDEDGHEPSTPVVSEALAVVGLESTLQATLDTGTLLVNGEPASLPATITPGDGIAIALTTPEDWAASATATLTVGPLTRTFTAATRPESVTLLNLAFKDVTLSMPGVVHTTKPAKVRDIAEPLAVSLSNGAEVSVNGGPWDTSATLANGDTIRIRMAASTESLGVATTMVTIGGHDYPWTITTADLVSAPPAYVQISFTPTTGANPDARIASPQRWLYFAPAGYSVVQITGGEGAPEIRAAGSSNWSTGPLLVRNGIALQIRATSADAPLTSRTTTLAVGSRSTSWSLTTRDLIRTPNAFSFPQLSNQEPNSLVQSTQVRLQGHEVPIPVSVSDGFEIRNVTVDNAAGVETWGTVQTVAPP